MIYKFKPFLGPEQFVFIDPDTGLRYGPEKSKKVLIDRIKAYRMQNKLPELEFLDDVLENYWCGLPENVGRCEPRQLKLGILPAIKGGIAILKNYLYDKVVSQDVAEKRAEQCSTCEFNVLPEDGGLRAWLDLVAINSVKGHRTKYYDKLGMCGVCNCALNMKVFYAGTLDKAGPKEMAEYDKVNCWQKGLMK